MVIAIPSQRNEFRQAAGRMPAPMGRRTVFGLLYLKPESPQRYLAVTVLESIEKAIGRIKDKLPVRLTAGRTLKQCPNGSLDPCRGRVVPFGKLIVQRHDPPFVRFLVIVSTNKNDCFHEIGISQTGVRQVKLFQVLHHCPLIGRSVSSHLD